MTEKDQNPMETMQKMMAQMGQGGNPMEMMRTMMAQTGQGGTPWR